MADRVFDSGWVDRYVRNELSTDDEMTFEAALFDSPALRGDVEAALSLQSLLQIEEAADTPAAEPNERRPGHLRLPPLAMAASFLVGVLGVSMWLQRASDITDLELQVAELQRPYSDVSIRRLDVMRSSGSTPAHLVRKPAEGGLLVLDVELSASTRDYPKLEVSLLDADGASMGGWRGSIADRERITLAIPSSRLSAGEAAIEIKAGGEVVESWPVRILD